MAYIKMFQDIYRFFWLFGSSLQRKENDGCCRSQIKSIYMLYNVCIVKKSASQRKCKPYVLVSVRVWCKRCQRLLTKAVGNNRVTVHWCTITALGPNSMT